MAVSLLKKCDKIINCLTLLVIVGGGSILHTLTSLAIRGYYGDPWGYVAFLAPGVAEAYLAVIQMGDEMYNYSVLLAVFCTMSLVTALLWVMKNVIKSRLTQATRYQP
jgi:hypothetical protein